MLVLVYMHYLVFVSMHLLSMRVILRPGGLASFGLRVSSDYDDARSIGTCGSLVLLPISFFFMRHHLRFEVRVVFLLYP